MRQAKRGLVGLGGTGVRLVRRRRRFDSASALLSLLSKQTWCFTSTETIRLIRDGEKGGGMKVVEEGDYIPIATNAVTTRMTPALRWAAMRAILMFH